MSSFESNKPFIGPWIILIMLALVAISGCDKYDEGDQRAKQSFEKMTIVERGMYDAVEKAWNQKYLVNIRQAVSSREVKPLENNIPFIDIANVIKSNNDITLKIEDSWRTDTKNEAISGRWDRLDGKWYVKIITKLGIKEADIRRQDFVVEEIIPDKPVDSDVVIQPSPIDEKSAREEKYFDTVDDIILLEEYDDLYYSLRGCQPAIDKYGTMIETRLITNGDRDFLIQMATKCKAQIIKAKLNPWKR